MLILTISFYFHQFILYQTAFLRGLKRIISGKLRGTLWFIGTFKHDKRAVCPISTILPGYNYTFCYLI